MEDQAWTASQNLKTKSHILIWAIILIAVFLMGIKILRGQEQVGRKVIITDEAYTASYSWDTDMTATVKESPCRACLRRSMLADCKKYNLCLKVKEN